MNKVKRKELVEKANEHELRLFQIEKALEQHGINWFAEEPKLKQLDQSVFDGKHSCLHFAFVNKDGSAMLAEVNPITHDGENFNYDRAAEYEWLPGVYDTSDWQNSLIERDIAKELLEVDLGSELTGSDLCRKMLERGDKFVVCFMSNGHCDTVATSNKEVGVATNYNLNTEIFSTLDGDWDNAIPINNQGEPLTAADVGL